MPTPATTTTATLVDPVTGAACVVTDVAVEADVLALDATIRLTQRFRNPLDRAIEAVYVFPLPPLAAVTSMRATLGGRTVVARLKERGEARREYAEAVSSGRRAALAEEERPSTFTMTVGNLAAGEDAEVVLELVGPVEVTARLDTAGVVEAWDAVLRLPTVVAPRYTEGQPLAGADVGSGTAKDTDLVPDASRVTPPVGEGVGPALTWRVHLEPAGLPLGAIDAPAGADRTPEPAGGVVVSGTGTCDADVSVRWQLAPTSLAVAASVHADAEEVEAREGHATVSLTVVPPVGTRPRAPADVVIALDRSGSMEGWKMRTAIRAARRLLDTLATSDRVGLVAFDTTVEGNELGLLPLTGPNRERLHERMEGVYARGGTELTPAITAAAHLLGAPTDGRERLVLLVTDAQVSGEQQALAAAQATGARFVVVGVDTAVNHGLLERLGAATGGSSTAVTAASELDRAVEIARHRLGAPTLERLRLHVPGLLEGSLAGDHRDVVWPDAIARLGVRIEKAGPLEIQLDADGPSGPWHESVTASETASEAGRLTWARARLRALEDDFDGGGDTRPSDLVEVSLAHGVLCRFTAFVAVDEAGDVVGDGTPPQTVVQPSELPQGWAPLAAAPRGGAGLAKTADAAVMPLYDVADRPLRALAALPPEEPPATYATRSSAGTMPPRAGRTPFWEARPGATVPSEAIGDRDRIEVVQQLNAAITKHGPTHRKTRAALAKLLELIAPVDRSGAAQRIVSEVVSRGCTVSLERDALVFRPAGRNEEVCRVDLAVGVVLVPGRSLGSTSSDEVLAAVLDRLTAVTGS